MKISSKSIIIKISSAMLLILNIYLILSDPLDKIYSYTKILLLWAILMSIVSYLLRKNEIYKEISYIIFQGCFTILYLLLPL